MLSWRRQLLDDVQPACATTRTGREPRVVGIPCGLAINVRIDGRSDQGGWQVEQPPAQLPLGRAARLARNP